MGKGRDPNANSGGSEHVSRPLTTLKDPNAFGPPPKNVNYHGGAALPNEITPHRGGLGAPLSQAEIQAGERVVNTEPEQQEEEKPKAPPLPYRADRTGLQTSHLPPPPVHRAVAEEKAAQTTGTTATASKAKPKPPPRLPSRGQSTDTVATSSTAEPLPPPAYEAVSRASTSSSTAAAPASNGFLNQSAVNRLGKAGVSVPSLGIGESNPWKNERSPPTAATTSPAPSQMSELQARFSRMSASPGSPQTQAQAQSPPAEGTTLEQKQAAMNTAANFHKDPSSVTLADAQSAASTANNFRQRHQEQISAGAQKANTWNKKFNVTGKVNNFLEKQASPVTEQPPAGPLNSPSPGVSDPLAGRKPPPPPPPKKPAGMHAPPPVPIGTKPSFG